MKKIIAFLLLTILAVRSFAGTEVAMNMEINTTSDPIMGYFITPNKKVRNNIKFIKEGRSEMSRQITIAVEDGNQRQLLFPDDIIEFGFINGTKYISAIIPLNGQEERVFLEEFLKLENNTTYYIYCNDMGKDLYLVQNGNQPIQFVTDNGEQLRNTFRERAKDCILKDKIDKYPMKMKRSSINKMNEAYSNCNINLFPRFHFGITGNVYMSMLNKGEEYSYDNEFFFYPGIFFDIPLDIRFSFHPEILFSYYSTTGKYNMGKGKIYNIKFKRKAILLPLMFRYRFTQSNGRFIPYLEVGPVVDFRISGEKKILSLGSPTRKVSPFQIGGGLGFGIEYKLNSKMSLYAGLRYSITAGQSADDEKENYNLFSFHISVGF